VWSAGDNSVGQLGDGTRIQKYRLVPVMADPSTPLGGVVAISAHGTSAFAVTKTGQLLAWGNNANNQCGLDPAVYGTAILYPTLVPVPTTGAAFPGFPNEPLLTINAEVGGFLFGQAIRSDGARFGWGFNLSGAVGDGTTFFRSSPVVGVGFPD
jgi:alpha-tubulin suppressor-like RCC1 family protein